MSREDILKTFRDLAQSQGYYGRLLEAIEKYEDEGDALLTHLEEQNFSDPVDLIMYVECNK